METLAATAGACSTRKTFMLLFVTLRPHTLFIDRRIRNFQNLNVEFRHLPLSGADYPQLFRRFDALRWIVKRIPVMMSAVARLRRELRSLGPQDILYVKAWDCLLATLIARLLARNRSQLVCEILDVHDFLLYPSPYRSMVRAFERLMLARIDLLVVPTEGNIGQYYRPIARYRGKIAVVHNRLPTGEAGLCPPPPRHDRAWAIGWFGNLRCRRSLDILCRTAEIMGDRVRILMAGPSLFAPGVLEQAIAPFANIAYLGPFKEQEAAPALYAQVHFSYALHFEPPDRSKWALAVRIFEGGAYGRPTIARADTDMGRFASTHGIGLTVQEPCEDTLAAVLSSLSDEGYGQMLERVRSQPHLFVGESHLEDALSLVKGGRAIT
jgi:succinoglycan biosynthesis protein ExoL